MRCDVSCLVLVPGGSPGCAHLCVALLCSVSLRACIGLCVSWCPFLRVASGLVWCWVSSCPVMWRGGASCGVPFRPVASWRVLLCCSRCPALCVAFASVWCWVLSCPVLWRGGASCVVPLCHVALWSALSSCVLVRWVGRWRVASGIVLRCCALLLVGLSRCIACCVAYRCLIVACGLVFLVIGLVVVCYVSALRGVVFLFCCLCPIVVPCSSVGLCRVVRFGVALPWFCGGVLVAVVCCAVPCCCERSCVVLRYVLCLGTRLCCVLVLRCTVV